MNKHLMDRLIGIARQHDLTICLSTAGRPNTHQDTLIQLQRSSDHEVNAVKPKVWQSDSNMCASGAFITPAMDISEEHFDD